MRKITYTYVVTPGDTKSRKLTTRRRAISEIPLHIPERGLGTLLAVQTPWLVQQPLHFPRVETCSLLLDRISHAHLERGKGAGPTFSPTNAHRTMLDA